MSNGAVTLDALVQACPSSAARRLIAQLRAAQQCAFVVRRRLTTDQEAERDDALDVFRLGALVLYSMVEGAVSDWIEHFRSGGEAESGSKVCSHRDTCFWRSLSLSEFDGTIMVAV